MSEIIDDAPVVALSEAEALRLARRLAASKGVTWPADPRAVHGVAGFRTNLTQLPGMETLVWATVDRTGIMGLFRGDRLVAAVPGEVGEILRVQAVDLPGLPHSAIMMTDRVDNLVGAFELSETEHIYVWDGRGLREVFAQPVLVEQFAHAQWSNRRAPAVWRLNRTLGTVDLHGGEITYGIRQQVLQAPGSPQQPIPRIQAFALVSEQRSTEHYRWDPRLRRFQRV